MGLSFSHCEARWAFWGFMQFRRRLAVAVGIDLGAMRGFEDRSLPPPTIPGCPWDGIDDPIVGLLNHSDCDGHLTPDQCLAIAPRLRELVGAWPDGDHGADYDKKHALLLAEGMELAIDLDQDLVFWG